MFKIIYFIVLISVFGLFVLYWKYVNDTIKDIKEENKNFKEYSKEELEDENKS